MEPADDAVAQRQAWFERYLRRLRGIVPEEASRPGQLVRCPCCHCRTLNERGVFSICAVCFWEDDGQDNADADVVRGGPNGGLSLAVARENYLKFGACEAKLVAHVRPPTAEEMDADYSI